GLEKGTLHPRDAKMRLAHTFVRMYHGQEAADEAERHFRTVFQQGKLPEEMDEVEIPPSELKEGKMWIVRLLNRLGLVSSNGEARRFIQQSAVRIDGEKVTDTDAELPVTDGMVVQVGKRRFAKVKLVRG
ncbi:MAG: S4 domain-containing protein, partial [Planifilum fimeticola]